MPYFHADDVQCEYDELWKQEKMEAIHTFHVLTFNAHNFFGEKW